MDTTNRSAHFRPKTIEFRRYSSIFLPCDYFADRTSAYYFAESVSAPPEVLYAALCSHGWRRQGRAIYQPACTGCKECISCRVNTEQFQPDPTMRRTLRRNSDLELTIKKIPKDTQELYDLYLKYISARHPNSIMRNYSEDEFQKALFDTCCATCILEYRLNTKLVCAAITDVLPIGLSAVYTFFDPLLSSRSLGTYSILRQIDLTQRLTSAKYLYLGYWLPSVRNMSYKTRFQPAEVFWNQQWQPLQQCLDDIQASLAPNRA